MSKIHVTVWNEFIHEKKEETIAKIYPEGIHGAIAQMLNSEESIDVRTATLEMPEHGLSDEVLNSTDVLIWWGHLAHDKVSDDVAESNKGRGSHAIKQVHVSDIISTEFFNISQRTDSVFHKSKEYYFEGSHHSRPQRFLELFFYSPFYFFDSFSFMYPAYLIIP